MSDLNVLEASLDGAIIFIKEADVWVGILDNASCVDMVRGQYSASQPTAFLLQHWKHTK